MLEFNKPPIEVKLTKEELQEFWIFCNDAINTGFTGINNFSRFEPEREEFFMWHMKELATKTANQLIKVQHHLKTKNTKIKVNYMEQRTLSKLFNRVNQRPFLMQMYPRFIKGLQPLEKRNYWGA